MVSWWAELTIEAMIISWTDKDKGKDQDKDQEKDEDKERDKDNYHKLHWP